jgi:hypothetical protein
LKRTAIPPFENSVVVGHGRKKAKVTAMEQQELKRKATKTCRGSNLTLYLSLAVKKLFKCINLDENWAWGTNRKF